MTWQDELIDATLEGRALPSDAPRSAMIGVSLGQIAGSIYKGTGYALSKLPVARDIAVGFQAGFAAEVLKPMIKPVAVATPVVAAG